MFVGDGGLQNCPTGLSTMARYGLDNIVFVMDNGTYSIDQFLVNPAPFVKEEALFEGCNYLPHWDYVKLVEAFGGKGYKATNVKELAHAITEAKQTRGKPTLIVVSIPERDLPKNLRNLLEKK